MVLVILDLDGDLQQNTAVTLEIRSEDNVLVTQTRTRGSLPPMPDLALQYRNWQSLYRNLWFIGGLNGSKHSIFKGSPQELEIAFRQSSEQLVSQFNQWLRSESFCSPQEKLLEKLSPQEEIRFIVQVENTIIRCLPWHLWDFFERYLQAELSFGTPAYERVNLSFNPRGNARILAILGHSQGIDIERDRRLVSQLPNTEIIFLVEPSRKLLYQSLWDAKGWDMLFFAGYRSNQENGENGYLEINEQEKIDISEINHALKKAVKQGVKIAIFNSCDGLRLVQELENLHIPQVIVMREPVPNQVAQEFLKYFLTSFTEGNSFYLAVREARESLQILENRYPCASWFPVICQNPTELPITWHQLTGKCLNNTQHLTPNTQHLTPNTQHLTPNTQHPTPNTQPFPCPYKGLSAFTQQDEPLFFGRKNVIEKLVYAVYTKPFIATIGSSGSGKSSVIFAGVIPKIKEEAIIIDLRPSNRPFLKLAEQFIACLEPDLEETERRIEVNKLSVALIEREINLENLSDRILQNNPNKRRFVLFLDQFEEIYTLCSDLEIRQNFIQFLIEPLRDRSNSNFYSIGQRSRLTLVLTLRADFLENVLSYRPFADLLCEYPPEILQPMNRAELQEAIERPAQQINIDFEEGLRDRILDAVGEEPGNLPLLEFALTRLWENRENDTLTYRAYEKIGGVKWALAYHAEAVYQTLTPEEKEQSRHIFLQLVHRGEAIFTTRRVATRQELGDNYDLLLQKLVDARLLVVSYHEWSQEITIELVHEVLIRVWDRLQNWIESDRRFPTFQESDRRLIKHRLLFALIMGLIASLSLTAIALWQWHCAKIGDIGMKFNTLYPTTSLRKNDRPLCRDWVQ